MFNKLIMVGHLTRDIELRYGQNGSAVAKSGIASTRKYTLNGEKKEETCFIDIVFFGRDAEVANQYLRKGSKTLLEGRLQFDQWVDQQSGLKRSKHVFVVEKMQMMDSKDDAARQVQGQQENRDYHGNQTSQQPPRQNTQQQPDDYAPRAESGYTSLPEISIDDQDIPF